MVLNCKKKTSGSYLQKSQVSQGILFLVYILQYPLPESNVFGAKFHMMTMMMTDKKKSVSITYDNIINPLTLEKIHFSLIDVNNAQTHTKRKLLIYVIYD